MAFKNIVMLIALIAMSLNLTEARDVLKADTDKEEKTPEEVAKLVFLDLNKGWDGFMTGMYKVQPMPDSYNSETCFGPTIIDDGE